MKKSDIVEMPKFFDRYIHQVKEVDLVEGLTKYLTWFDEEFETLKKLEDYRYAPGKWTPKEVIQHITDNERVQSYRAMRISRNDPTVLPGYDENLLAANANVQGSSLRDVIDEFKLIRQSNIIMFRNCTEEMLQRTGICFEIKTSVLALGFMILGHQIHHMKILEERYFN